VLPITSKYNLYKKISIHPYIFVRGIWREKHSNKGMVKKTSKNIEYSFMVIPDY